MAKKKPKITTLYSTQEAADEVGLSVQRVRQLAQANALGQMVGSTLVFCDVDIRWLQNRNTKAGPPHRLK